MAEKVWQLHHFENSTAIAVPNNLSHVINLTANYRAMTVFQYDVRFSIVSMYLPARNHSAEEYHQCADNVTVQLENFLRKAQTSDMLGVLDAPSTSLLLYYRLC